MLDTSIVSEPLRPLPNTSILARLERHQSKNSIAAVVWHELWFGCYRLPAAAKRAAIERYLNEVVAGAMQILHYDDRAAERHAPEWARLIAAGKTPSFADGQIIAVAAMHELTLVTLNEADIADYSGLQVVNWATSSPHDFPISRL